MGNDAIGYFFIILLLMIAAPLIFWILSILYAWVKWLFNDRKKLNESYSRIHDVENPSQSLYKVKYKLGLDTKVELFITDTKFNELRTILSESKERGTHVYELNTKELGNGMYFLKLKTENQTLTKQIVIEN